MTTKIIWRFERFELPFKSSTYAGANAMHTDPTSRVGEDSMTTDRELLERAARAFGERVPPRFYPDGSCVFLSGQVWNPLSDDGDALRLAVKLNLHLAIECESAGAVTVEWGFDNSGTAAGSIEEDAPEGGDDYAAVRRALVRAAAAIGGQVALDHGS